MYAFSKSLVIFLGVLTSLFIPLTLDGAPERDRHSTNRSLRQHGRHWHHRGWYNGNGGWWGGYPYYYNYYPYYDYYYPYSYYDHFYPYDNGYNGAQFQYTI